MPNEPDAVRSRNKGKRPRAPAYGDPQACRREDVGDLVLAVGPRWAELILSGRKWVELRRRIPRRPVGRALIYATAPKRAIVGFCTVQGTVRLPIQELFELAGQGACISKHEFSDYFRGCSNPGALLLKDPVALAEAIHPAHLSSPTGKWVVPQSFRYLPGAFIDSLLEPTTDQS
jgi:predicted transcriptional regulator